MRLRYPALLNAAFDREANDHQTLFEAWRNVWVLEEVMNARGSTPATREGERQLSLHYRCRAMAENYDLIV